MTQADVSDTTAAAFEVDQLLFRVASGDQAAFESLYHATSRQLMGVCLRVLTDRSEAEDVLQDVYVTVWGKAAQFDGTRARGIAWLASIARHRAIDRLRALPTRAARAPIDTVESLPDPTPSPAARTEQARERARLDECLEQLEPRRQGLIRTAFFDGATYEELASRSGSPLGSVKSWIRRGLQQLRMCLEQ
ncbi:sigma-70 family RNA polymerase sigma factor [Agrilutibacter solisilvae]|uniref:RNA polymerase sigma factor n=1 Tax=Agrilutibacter solisilvae TaxID=2763317 RepID=A0A974Y4E3_9GAMM|nr:sigma-70 family RNA polymerase sigma factor [Lysobacter solisilvae]QSX77701.1 sigma-70 family RNA polymerase sigma factor [Lysobacter solisilvae]